MRVATWNVNSVKQRLPRLLPWLDERAPDVVCLQETKLADDGVRATARRRAGGARLRVRGPRRGAWNGVAILSRVGLDDVVPGLPGGPGFPEQEARAVSATCGGVRVWSVYVPNGREPDSDHYRYKLDWLAALREEVAAGPRRRSGLRRHEHRPDRRRRLRPGRLRGPDPRHPARARRARRAARRPASTTSSATAGPTERVFSYWDYRAGMFHKDLGMRIDLVLAGTPVADRVEAAWVDRKARKGKGPSDHAPVIVDLDEAPDGDIGPVVPPPSRPQPRAPPPNSPKRATIGPVVPHPHAQYRRAPTNSPSPSTRTLLRRRSFPAPGATVRPLRAASGLRSGRGRTSSDFRLEAVATGRQLLAHARDFRALRRDAERRSELHRCQSADNSWSSVRRNGRPSIVAATLAIVARSVISATWRVCSGLSWVTSMFRKAAGGSRPRSGRRVPSSRSCRGGRRCRCRRERSPGRRRVPRPSSWTNTSRSAGCARSAPRGRSAHLRLRSRAPRGQCRRNQAITVAIGSESANARGGRSSGCARRDRWLAEAEPARQRRRLPWPPAGPSAWLAGAGRRRGRVRGLRLRCRRDARPRPCPPRPRRGRERRQAPRPIASARSLLPRPRPGAAAATAGSHLRGSACDRRSSVRAGVHTRAGNYLLRFGQGRAAPGVTEDEGEPLFGVTELRAADGPRLERFEAVDQLVDAADFARSEITFDLRRWSLARSLTSMNRTPAGNRSEDRRGVTRDRLRVDPDRRAARGTGRRPTIRPCGWRRGPSVPAIRSLRSSPPSACRSRTSRCR